LTIIIAHTQVEIIVESIKLIRIFDAIIEPMSAEKEY